MRSARSQCPTSVHYRLHPLLQHRATAPAMVCVYSPDIHCTWQTAQPSRYPTKKRPVYCLAIPPLPKHSSPPQMYRPDASPNCNTTKVPCESMVDQARIRALQFHRGYTTAMAPQHHRVVLHLGCKTVDEDHESSP